MFSIPKRPCNIYRLVQANRWRLGMPGGKLEDEQVFEEKNVTFTIHHPCKTLEIHTYPMPGNRFFQRAEIGGKELCCLPFSLWLGREASGWQENEPLTGMTEVQGFWDKIVMKTHWAAYIVWDSSLENPTFGPSKVMIFQMTRTYRSNWRILRYFWSSKQISPKRWSWITFLKTQGKQTLEVWWHCVTQLWLLQANLQKPCFWHPNKRSKERVFLMDCLLYVLAVYVIICDDMWSYTKLYIAIVAFSMLGYHVCGYLVNYGQFT